MKAAKIGHAPSSLHWKRQSLFAWPGYDLRPIRENDGRVDYGFLPPRLFDQIIEMIRRLDEKGAIARTSRDF